MDGRPPSKPSQSRGKKEELFHFLSKNAFYQDDDEKGRGPQLSQAIFIHNAGGMPKEGGGEEEEGAATRATSLLLC